MKNSKWFIIGIIIILILTVLGYAYYKGWIHTSWQWLTAILAALAGPFEMIATLFGKNKKLENIIKNSTTRKQTEINHRLVYDNIIQKKEQRIQELQAQVNKQQDQIDSLDLNYKEIDKKYQNETDITTLQNQFLDAYGDES